jgi:hypothetical protein
MDSVLVSSAVDRGFESRSGQIKDYRIRICCFPENFTALRRKSKDKLTRSQDNVSEWGDMSIRRLLFPIHILCTVPVLFNLRINLKTRFS